jgi:hypothetical protein
MSWEWRLANDLEFLAVVKKKDVKQRYYSRGINDVRKRIA